MKETQNYSPKLSQLYHLQFDAVKTWQSRPLELTNDCV